LKYQGVSGPAKLKYRDSLDYGKSRGRDQIRSWGKDRLHESHKFSESWKFEGWKFEGWKFEGWKFEDSTGLVIGVGPNRTEALKSLACQVW